MEIFNSLQDLVDEEFDLLATQTVWFFFENLEEVAIHEFKNEVQLALSKSSIGYQISATYRLKASIILTTDLSLSTLSILTSRLVVFLTI